MTIFGWAETVAQAIPEGVLREFEDGFLCYVEDV